jgi:hypothetical protein
VRLERADDAVDDSLDQGTEPWDDALRWPDRHPDGERRARRARRARDVEVVALESQPYLFEFLGAGEGAEVNSVPCREFAFLAPVPARGVSATELVPIAVGEVATCP